MPSTYSPNLRLELQATGENATTWGVNANNVFSRIEDAISSTVALNMADANQTLTVVNGNVDQSRCMFINCTGAMTAARTVTIPASSKMYVFRNNTTGGFGINVSNGVNSLFVPVGGYNVIIMTDGTNLYYATNLADKSYLYLNDASSSPGPDEVSFRESASPAAFDFIGRKRWIGRNSIAATLDYVLEEHRIINATNGAERGQKTVTVYGGSGTSASYNFDTTSFNGTNLGEVAIPWTRGVFSNANSTHGITFGSTDDYMNIYRVNRSFTPTLRGATVAGAGTYITRIGRYSRIGNVVHILITLVWSAHTGTGEMQITGLPFTTSSVAGFVVFPVSYSAISLAAGTLGVVGVAANSSTTIEMLNLPQSGGGRVGINMDTAGTFNLSGTYFVDS